MAATARRAFSHCHWLSARLPFTADASRFQPTWSETLSMHADVRRIVVWMLAEIDASRPE
jgi:hypothetical protein